jgi:hypothetical protein
MRYAFRDRTLRSVWQVSALIDTRVNRRGCSGGPLRHIFSVARVLNEIPYEA